MTAQKTVSVKIGEETFVIPSFQSALKVGVLRKISKISDKTVQVWAIIETVFEKKYPEVLEAIDELDQDEFKDFMTAWTGVSPEELEVGE